MSASDSWNEVADSVAGLALKLKLHLEEATSGPTEEVRSAVADLGKKVEAAFDALHSAVTDPAVRDDVKNVAGEFRDALANTFAEVSAHLRR